MIMYIPENDNVPVDDRSLNTAYDFDATTTERNPYKTNTRFKKDDAGVWQAMPAERDEPRPKTKTTPEGRKVARQRVAERQAEERKAMSKITKVIRKRQDIGNPSVVQSRGEDFPLLETLRRDNMHHHIKLVLDYRALVALCEAEPLKGLDYSKADGGETVRETVKLTPEADIDRAALSDWKDVPDGEIRYSSKLKKSKGAFSLPAKRKGAAHVKESGETSAPKTESLHVKLTDEVLIAHIDAKPILAELRAALGPLLEPFEDAVLGAKSFTQIGKHEGVAYKPDIVGRTLVMRAMSALQGAWHDVAVRERKSEKTAERNLHRKYISANDNTRKAKAA